MPTPIISEGSIEPLGEEVRARTYLSGYTLGWCEYIGDGIVQQLKC